MSGKVEEHQGIAAFKKALLDIPPSETLVITIQGFVPAHRNSRRLFGRRGPMGKIVCDVETGQVVVFDRATVHRYLSVPFTPPEPVGESVAS